MVLYLTKIPKTKATKKITNELFSSSQQWSFLVPSNYQGSKMASKEEKNRVEKVRRIFQEFDKNKDGGLNTEEMTSLVISVNPRVQFSDEQITAILEEVFRTYSEFINGDDDKGLTFEGLLRTYNDGAGDVDRDFAALKLHLVSESSSSSSIASITAADDHDHDDDQVAVAEIAKKQTWILSPSHEVVYGTTWKIVEELDGVIKRLRGKQLKEGRLKINKGNEFDSFSDQNWSSEFRLASEFSENGVVWDESGQDYVAFVKQLGVLRRRIDEQGKSIEEVFDGHMAIGRVLYERHLFRESLVSFKQSCEIQPMNFKPHFRVGNCFYILGKYREAKVEFQFALEAAKMGGDHSTYLLPQIHVNLGISLEAEGMILGACEHYKEAAVLCPTHFRALKLLGSALFGVGEYMDAEKALEEAIFLKADYADAHCDLGSTLHARGETERGIQELQKAIDLNPGHVDAMFNLGGVYMDLGRYNRASEMYTRILVAWPNHWRAQLNKAVALLGANEAGEAKKALKEALKMTNRVELHDALTHIKHIQKKSGKGNGGTETKAEFVIVEASKFKRANEETASRKDLAIALDIRFFQRVTRLSFCDLNLVKKEVADIKVTVFDSEKFVTKSALEKNLRRLLHFLKPETFQDSVKAINTRILHVFDPWDSNSVDLGMFYAVLAPICCGPSEERKKVVYDALLWRNADGGSSVVKKVDVVRYIELLRTVYLPSLETSGLSEVHGQAGDSTISFVEFLQIFDDPDCGFGIMDTLQKLEIGDRIRHCGFSCSVCRYPISGSCFKETRSRFNLCSQCYSEGKVPSAIMQEEYNFKEYKSEAESIKDKCSIFRLHSRGRAQIVQ